MATALFGAGCFWCTEAVMKSLKGVSAVRSGYAGGKLDNPNYEVVSTGTTGHAEVVEVTFDPMQLTYEQLLEVFFGTHDPTQLNRQGNDVGTQYRSVIYFTDESQKTTAEMVKKRLDEANTFGAKIITAIEPAGTFYPAENYHQNYYALNPGNPYCQAIISPKVAKLRNKFAPLLKD